uniref:Lipoprotein n=1 Tax=uncultured bacterium contig00003 TaxID=1181495 RepID=A0A806KK72_9BACT|nr:hypothetical protein [uncultured bacterium contig00003]
MKKNKFLIVAIIGIIMAVGMVMFSCGGSNCDEGCSSSCSAIGNVDCTEDDTTSCKYGKLEKDWYCK